MIGIRFRLLSAPRFAGAVLLLAAGAIAVTAQPNGKSAPPAKAPLTAPAKKTALPTRGNLPSRGGSPGDILPPAPLPTPTPTPVPTPTPIPTPTPFPLEEFPFALPPFDDTKNAVDVSWLNEVPAGKSGFVRVDGEHFVDGQGKVLRFWGVNVSYQGAFPDKAEASKVAARLAKFGFNAVRLHQYETSISPGSLWKAAGIGSSRIQQPREIDPAQLDKLDFFVAELIKRGLYVDLNLHVGRKTLDSDGVPYAATLPDKDKGVNYFSPRLITLQKEFARTMLTHVNPYLGHALNEEPGLAMVELYNENSLLGTWLEGKLGRVPADYLNPLRDKWNLWLKARYDSASLRRAWTEWDEPIQPDNLIGTPLPPEYVNPDAPDAIVMRAMQNLKAWQLTTVAPAQGSLSVDALSGAIVDSLMKPGLIATLQTPGTVRAAGGVSWAYRLQRNDVPLQENQPYVLAFWARSEKYRRVALSVSGGFYTVFDLSPSWKKYSFAFRPKNFRDDLRQIALSLGNEAGNVQLSEPELHQGGRQTVPDEWTFDNGVPLPEFGETGVTRTRRDFAEFLGSVEADFAGQMRDYLKTEIGVKCPLWLTQAQFGGWGGLWRESHSDVIDQHVYWKHPDLGENGWAGGDWQVGNSSMVNAGEDNPLSAFGLWRLQGKPFVVSEWNSGAPNDFGAETLPMAAALASWQDWAGIFVFDYHARGDYGRDRIEGPFSIDSHPVKMALAPASALLFRRAGEGQTVPGDVQSAQRSTTLMMPEDALWNEVASVGGGPFASPVLKTWRDAGASRSESLLGKTYVRFVQPGAALFPTSDRAIPNYETNFTSDTGQIFWEEKPGLFTVNTPRTKLCAGFLGGRNVELGELQLAAPTSISNWSCVALSSLDNEEIFDSKKLLLTIAGKAENLNMSNGSTRGANGVFSSDFWGSGPTQVEGINLTARLKTMLPAPHVWALDVRGERATEVPSTLQNGTLQFTAAPSWKTLWYEIGE